MSIKLLSKHKLEGITIFSFISKYFQIRWFTSFKEWYLYIHLGNKYYRFSSCGYLKGKTTTK